METIVVLMANVAFHQVDVFTGKPCLGNPLAVILDATSLQDAEIRGIARWTNLSETTFVFPPSSSASDYKVRIMTPETELMFAGHPTLGTCAALLAQGVIQPRLDGTVVQECGVGLVTIRVISQNKRKESGNVIGRFAFKAPAVRGEPSPLRLELGQVLFHALGLPLTEAAAECQPHVVNIGIAWLLAEAPSHELLLAAQPSAAALSDICRATGAFGVTIFALNEGKGEDLPGGPFDLELRTFLLENGKLVEDPVCGSANACVAHFLQLVPSLKGRYLRGGAQEGGWKTGLVVRQGSMLKREGRVYVSYEGEEGEGNRQPWIAGDVTSVISGTINL